MTSRLGSAAALAAACLLLVPALARADVSVPCSGLQNALDTQPAGSTITLTTAEGLCAGTYFLPETAITLHGEDGAGFQTVGGGRSLTTEEETCRQCVRRAPATGAQNFDNLVFKGTAIGGGTRREGGNQGGGMFWQGDDLTIRDTTFQDVDSDDPGGALWVDNQTNGFPYGKVTLDGVDFLRNSSGNSGGGARISGADVTITNGTFTENHALDNGGGLALTLARGEEIGGRGPAPTDVQGTISQTTFTGNYAGTYLCNNGGAAGGGLWAGDRQTTLSGEEPPPPRRADTSAATLAVGDNTYDSNAIGTTDPECIGGDVRGGGAAYAGIDVVGYTTETYRDNTADGVTGDVEGGGFAVTATGFRGGTYTGENTVVIGNGVHTDPIIPQRPARSVDDGEPPSGGGIYVGGPLSSELALVHPTIVNNTVTTENVDAYDEENPGAGVSGHIQDTATLDRAILYDNDSAFSQAPAQINGFGEQTVTNSDWEVFSDRRAPDANGNVNEPPVFDAVLGAPIQDESSPSVNALDTTPIADDFLHQDRPSPEGGKADMGAHELQFAPPATPSPSPSASPAPSASPTASPTPVTTVQPTQTPDDSDLAGEQGGGSRRCSGRRFFPIKLRRLGYTFVSAVIHVNGKRVKTVRYKSGRLGARIDLRRFPKRTIRVRIRATTSTGRVIKGKRVYHPCTKKRPHTVPEL